MVKSRSGKILVIDNDVLVYIFDNLYTSDQFSFGKVIQFLSLTYGRIWIPGEVRHEFLHKRNDKRRLRIISRVYRDHSVVCDCPITVGLNEKKLVTGMKDENLGEADAVLQSQKAKAMEKLFFEDIVFLSNDGGALKLARKRLITTLAYANLKSRIQETGISLP
jgi:hypothetical protein